MISSTTDLWIALGVFFVMPLIIWINLFNRQLGITGYLWRESPWLTRIGLGFLGLIWFATAVELAAHYGLVSDELAQTGSIVLGLPMLVLSVAILAMAGVAFAKYLKSRKAT
jgi:hypothetical protein